MAVSEYSLNNNKTQAKSVSICEYSFDQTGRIKLEPKEQIKEKLGKSPDLADGLVLTFAFPVSPVSLDYNQQSRKCKTEYDPFEF